MILPQEAVEVRSDYLALVGIDGHIYVQRADGSNVARVTWNARSLSYGVWKTGDTHDRLRHFWPTWSPRGDKLACLGTYGNAEEEQGTAVYVLDVVQGIESWEIWTGASSSPIYLSWAPDGERLAFVLQQQDALNLVLASLQRPGESMPVLTGVPLYHRFSPDGQSLAVHLGGRFNGEPGRRLYQIDLDSPDRRLTLSDHPGLFGTPAWSPDGQHLAFTVEEDGVQHLCLSPFGRGPTHRLGKFSGVGALMWSSDGQQLLLAVAPSGEQASYEQLWSYPVDGGAPELLLEERFLGCFNAAGGRLAFVRHGARERSLQWRLREPSGQQRTLATFFPSQPQLFMLHFFHQYYLSHRLVSPDGTRLLFAGYLSKEEMEDDHTLPRVFLVDLSSEEAARPIGEGSVACWAPADPTLGSS